MAAYYGYKLWCIYRLKPTLKEALADRREFVLVLRPFDSNIYDEEHVIRWPDGETKEVFKDNIFEDLLEKIKQVAVVLVGGRTGIQNCYDLVQTADEWEVIEGGFYLFSDQAISRIGYTLDELDEYLMSLKHKTLALSETLRMYFNEPA